MALLVNDNLSIRAPKSIDNRYGAYPDVATALAAVPQNFRFKGLTVGVDDGGTIVEHWFANGVTDGDLIPKTNLDVLAAGSGLSEDSGNIDLGGQFNKNVALTAAGTETFSITTNGGNLNLSQTGDANLVLEHSGSTGVLNVIQGASGGMSLRNDGSGLMQIISAGGLTVKTTSGNLNIDSDVQTIVSSTGGNLQLRGTKQGAEGGSDGGQIDFYTVPPRPDSSPESPILRGSILTGGEWTFEGNVLKNVADPIDENDVATKGWVEALQSYSPIDGSGLSAQSNTFDLGGTINKDATVSYDGTEEYSIRFRLENTANDNLADILVSKPASGGIVTLRAGQDDYAGVSLSKSQASLYFENNGGGTYSLKVNASGIIISGKGASYDLDTSAENTNNPRWIPDKEWVETEIGNAVLEAAEGGANQLSELEDVSDATATDGNVLVANGTEFNSQKLNASQVEFTPEDQSSGSIWDGLLTAGKTFIKNSLDRIAVLLNPKAAVSGGAADVYTATIPSVSSLLFGETITLKIHAANTGASTLDLNSSGAISIKKQDGTDPVADDLPLGKLVSLFYDDTSTPVWVIKDTAVAAGGGGSNQRFELEFNKNLTVPHEIKVDYTKTLSEELAGVSGVSYETYEPGVDTAWQPRADISAVNTEIGTWSVNGFVRVIVSSVDSNGIDIGFVTIEEA